MSEPKGKGGIDDFARRDHRFVFLGTSALCAAAVCVSLMRYAPGSAPVPVIAAWAVCLAWMLFSLVAGVYKLGHWDAYEKTSPFVQEPLRGTVRRISWVVWAVALALAAVVIALNLADAWNTAMSLTQNSPDFVIGGIYMITQQWPILLHGIEITVELALLGTVIAFFLALLLVFLRIQTPDRSDNYLVRFFKKLGSGFAAVYSTVIRGTPMMVQGLIIYYGGFAAFASTGMSVQQVQETWSFFIAGLVTISLCSAAYMAEVLRASIEAIDPGQMEAARSLGLSQWQAMSSVVFPQGVRNAMPALSNEFIVNIKDSSVLSVIGVFDLMYATTSITGIYYRQMEVYIATAVIYLILTLLAGKVLDLISANMGMSTRGILSTESENPVLVQQAFTNTQQGGVAQNA